MRKSLAAIVLGSIALMPQVAGAQAAGRDAEGNRYCFTKDVYLSETKAGLEATLYFWHFADGAGIAYPAGVRPWLGHDVEAHVKLAYAIPFDKAGKPTGRPKPVAIEIAAGKFPTAPGPRPLFTLQIKSGQILTPPLLIDPSASLTDAISINLAAIGSPNPEDSEMPPAKLNELVMALEQGPTFLVVLQKAKEIARIPIKQQSIAAERQAAFAWLQKTAPLLTTGKCA
ncbi:MAG: hypothetical protein EOP60_09665 [Sphingomonadales bacterium]|nr:MAG: hypothetical protein EOP60_09665 [Sphingomonadales bacterium]